MYISMRRQPVRLRNPKTNFGNFGQGDTTTGVITALGNAINGIISSITTSKVLISQSKDRANVAITESTQNTQKLQIATQGQVQQAQIAVENIQTTYSGITKLVIGAGVILSGVIVSGAFAYSLASKARGDYEIEYQVK